MAGFRAGAAEPAVHGAAGTDLDGLPETGRPGCGGGGAVHLAGVGLWSVLLVVAAAAVGLYFRAEAIVAPKAPGVIHWVVRVVVAVIAWHLLRQLPVLIHVRL